jgi:putative heme-binding domain-containing protein
VVGLSPEDPAAQRLLVELAQGDVPALRDEALRSLRGAALNADEKVALQAIGKADDRAAELVRRVLEPAAADRAAAPDDLAGWLERLDPEGRLVGGDPRAGERIFFHRKSAGCSNCHQIGGRGAKVGPELTATTGKLARGRLIESIVRPGKEIAPQFATWQVVTTSGKTMTGVLVKEEATGEQTYADSKGELVRFATGEIESRRPQSTSIMPDGLARQLTLQEFRDLLAFLQAPSGGEQ